MYVCIGGWRVLQVRELRELSHQVPIALVSVLGELSWISQTWQLLWGNQQVGFSPRWTTSIWRFWILDTTQHGGEGFPLGFYIQGTWNIMYALPLCLFKVVASFLQEIRADNYVLSTSPLQQVDGQLPYPTLYTSNALHQLEQLAQRMYDASFDLVTRSGNQSITGFYFNFIFIISY